MNFFYTQQFLLLICIGGIGAFIGFKLKIPAGVFIGSIIFVGVYQIIFGTIMEKPSWMKLIMQIAVGLVLGTRFTQELLLDFKKLIKPIIISSFTLIFSALVLGLTLSYLTDWDLATCILSAAPGGQTEMAILSDSIGAQTEKVIVLQLVRNQLVLIVMMPLVKLLMKKKEKEVDTRCRKNG